GYEHHHERQDQSSFDGRDRSSTPGPMSDGMKHIQDTPWVKQWGGFTGTRAGRTLALATNPRTTPASGVGIALGGLLDEPKRPTGRVMRKEVAEESGCQEALFQAGGAMLPGIVVLMAKSLKISDAVFAAVHGCSPLLR